MNESIGELIDICSGTLAGVSDSPRLDCQLLLGHVLGKGRDWLFAHSDEPLDCRAKHRFTELIQRRQNGEPVAYLIGKKGFWNREFELSPSTLIPRPETELLVELTLARFDEQPRQVLDLGTGTGALAVTLAAERPAWQLLAVDIDKEAVEVAQRNAADLANINIIEGNWFNGITQVFDLIVSNPPYIAEGDPHLDALAFEPAQALASGADGLDAIREIISHASDHLAEGGHLLLEHGYDQQATIVQILDDAGFTGIETFEDLCGQPRAVLAKNVRSTRDDDE